MESAASMVVEQRLAANRVAAELKIPYTTLAEWVKKYRAGGRAALEARPGGKRTSGYPQDARGRFSRTEARSTVDNRAGAAKRDPRREAVIAAKQAEPQAGSRRIRDVVKRFFGIGTSETTVRRVLQEQGLVEKRQVPKAKPRPKAKRFERAEPNQLWQSDLFTFLLRRHERVYVVAFLDDHSRYLVSLVMAHHQRSSLVLEALARGIADYGAPREILTDQGRQYTAWRGATGFEEELRRHGIRHIKSRPHHPQTCGKIERFWKTMWEEFLSRTVFADFDACQRRCALFVQHYNFQRPHQGLEGLTPADRFFRSAPQVRAAIESTVAANALRLAKEQPVQKPFYLVGRLGDRDLTISASQTGLKVRVGGEETTIPLSKEIDHHEDGTRVSRWSGGRASQEAPAPSDPEVAGELAGARRDRPQPLPDGAVGALGREAGDRRDRRDEDLSGHVLPAGGQGSERDACGIEPDCIGLGERQGGSLGGGGAHRAAAGAGRAPRAGEPAHAAAASSDAQVDAIAGDDGASWAAAQECAARIDPEWECALSGLEGEGDVERRFDYVEGWW